MLKMISCRQAVAAFMNNYSTNNSTMLYHRTISTCKHLFSDKNLDRKPQQKMPYSFFTDGFKKKFMFGKPLLRMFKGWSVMMTQKLTSDAYTDHEHGQSHDTEYERAFNDAVEAFSERSSKQDVGDTQIDLEHGQSHDTEYERAFNDAVEAFNEQSCKQHVSDIQTNYDSDQTSIVYGHAVIDSNLQYVCEMLQEMEATKVIAETNEMTNGLDFEEMIDAVIDSTTLSGPTDTVIDIGQPNEPRPQSIRRFFSINFTFMNGFCKCKRKKHWNLFQKRNKKGGDVFDDVIQKSFSEGKKAMLQQMIKDDINKQFKLTLQIEKSCQEMHMTQKQNTAEVSKEVLNNVLINILKNEIISGKINRLLNLTKERDTQIKVLKIFIRLIIKYFIYGQICEFLQSMEIFSAKKVK